MARPRTILLTLIRCGETPWEVEGRLHGRSDLPLSIDGRTAAADASRSLRGRKVPTVYHAPGDAATETAEIVAAVVGARTRLVPDLAGPDLGVLEGMAEHEFAERFPKRYKQWQDDPLSLSPPDGEPLELARERVFAAVARLLRRARVEEVAVVLDVVALGLLRCWLADRPATQLWAMVAGRPRVERYAVSAGAVKGLSEVASAQHSEA